MAGQRKVFCTQKTPESSCPRKEMLTYILKTSANDDIEIMQPIRITSGPVIGSGTSSGSSDKHLPK